MRTVITTVRLIRAPGMRMSFPAEAGGTGAVWVALVLVLVFDEVELPLLVEVAVERVDAPLESEESAEEIEALAEDAADSIEETVELAPERIEEALLDAAPEIEDATLLGPAVTGATMVLDDPEITVV
jgi:hypothetical protein